MGWEMVSEQQYQALLDAVVDTEDAVNLSYSAVSAQTVLAQLGQGRILHPDLRMSHPAHGLQRLLPMCRAMG